MLVNGIVHPPVALQLLVVNSLMFWVLFVLWLSKSAMHMCLRELLACT